MNLSGLVAPFLAVLLLSSCAADVGGASEPGPSETPVADSARASEPPKILEPSEAPVPDAPPVVAPVPVPALEFDLAMVRSNVVNKEGKGGQANVAVVAESTDLELLKQVGLRCVDHFLSEQKAAYCQVWGSEVDYLARDPLGMDEVVCWIYFVGVPLNGGEVQVSESSNITYGLSGCPGGVMPPAE